MDRVAFAIVFFSVGHFSYGIFMTIVWSLFEQKTTLVMHKRLCLERQSHDGLVDRGSLESFSFQFVHLVSPWAQQWLINLAVKNVFLRGNRRSWNQCCYSKNKTKLNNEQWAMSNEQWAMSIRSTILLASTDDWRLLVGWSWQAFLTYYYTMWIMI